MGKISVDFSDVQDFEAMPKGDYDCIIQEAKIVHPTDEGKYPYINLTLEVAEEGEYKGRKLWARWSLSPKALFRMKADLENMGLPVDEIDIDYDEDSDLVTSPELAGLPVTASVDQRTYQDKLQNEVQSLRSPNGAAAKTGAKKTAARGKRTFK